MTKEEMINKIIERYKSYKNKSFVNLVDCCGMDCENCPFKVTECADVVIKAIIERIKAEEHQETNLEHYIVTYQVDGGEGVFWIDKESKRMFDGVHDLQVFVKWLLQPYEPPKPKYKLSKFEHDLLECYHVSELGIRDYWVLDHMHKKGYFKNVPTDVFTEDILNNCEVTDE